MLRRFSLSVIQDLYRQWTPVLGQMIEGSRSILASPALERRRVASPQSNACMMKLFDNSSLLRNKNHFFNVPRLSCSSSLLATSFDLAASKIIQLFSSSTGQNASVGSSLMPLIHLHSLNTLDFMNKCCGNFQEFHGISHLVLEILDIVDSAQLRQPSCDEARADAFRLVRIEMNAHLFHKVLNF